MGQSLRSFTIAVKVSSLCALFLKKPSRAGEAFSPTCLHVQLNTEEERKNLDICTNVYSLFKINYHILSISSQPFE